jgi:1-acyl-sn-glycerol-3-phosphate acyltransferase
MLRTIVFFAWFWISLVLSLLVLLPYLFLSLFGLRKDLRHLFVASVRIWARSLLAFAGARIRVEGLERIPPDGKLCFVGNHQGDMDIVLILALMRRSVGFVTKSMAIYLPILNLWIAALGGVFIDRTDSRKALAAIERGGDNIKRGDAMVVFPEGTRSRGPAMGPFRKGSLKLATKAGATIVPITIDGTYRMWEAEKRIRPADISLVVHEPISTEGMQPEERKLLAERLRAIIASGLPQTAPVP